MTEADATNPQAEASTATAVAAVEAEASKETLPPPVKQTKCILLTGFGGPKYLRVQLKDQKIVGKGEIAIDVEAW